MVRRYFGSMSRKVHLLLSTELGGKPSPARAGTRATDVPLAKQFQRGKELQKSRVQFPTTRITTLVAELIHGDIDGTSESDAK